MVIANIVIGGIRTVRRMKLMIDISDSTYDSIMARDWKNAGWLFGEELKAIHDGTPIPENPTNGDMIKALFPDFKKYREFEFQSSYENEDISAQLTVEHDWWNSPYKRGETE